MDRDGRTFVRTASRGDPSPCRLVRPSDSQGHSVTIDIHFFADCLVRNGRISDHDLWRAIRDLDDAIFDLARDREPIPIEVLRLRAALRQARSRRAEAG